MATVIAIKTVSSDIRTRIYLLKANFILPAVDAELGTNLNRAIQIDSHLHRPRLQLMTGISKSLLKHELQCHLHRSPVRGGQDPAERGIGERYIRIAGIHMIRHVESLGPELYRLLLPNRKRSGQAHVDVDTSRTQNIH